DRNVTGVQTCALPISPPPHVMTPSAEESMRALVVRDTTTVSAALKRCAGQSMLPEQQTTWDAAMDLLAQVREALARGDLAQARRSEERRVGKEWRRRG